MCLLIIRDFTRFGEGGDEMGGGEGKAIVRVIYR
jgi:hypothetical protein